MTRRRTAAAAGLLALVLLVALLLASRNDPSPGIGADENARVGTRYEYGLMTHCGVDFIRFDGRWWEAQPHLDDGNGNPPDGWDNGIQEGTLTLRTEAALEFNASAGRTLQFVEVRTAPTPVICG